MIASGEMEWVWERRGEYLFEGSVVRGVGEIERGAYACWIA